MDRKIDQSLDQTVDVSIKSEQSILSCTFSRSDSSRSDKVGTFCLFCLFHEYVHTFLTILLIDRYFLIKYRKEEN